MSPLACRERKPIISGLITPGTGDKALACILADAAVPRSADYHCRCLPTPLFFNKLCGQRIIKVYTTLLLPPAHFTAEKAQLVYVRGSHGWYHLQYCPATVYMCFHAWFASAAAYGVLRCTGFISNRRPPSNGIGFFHYCTPAAAEYLLYRSALTGFSSLLCARCTRTACRRRLLTSASVVIIISTGIAIPGMIN